MRGIMVTLGLGLLPGCLVLNSDFQPAASGSDGASSSTSSSAASTGPTSSAATSSAASTGAGSLSAGVSATGEPTTGDLSSGTSTSGGSTGDATGGTTGEPPISCPPDQQTLITNLPVKRDNYFVTTPDPTCGWLDSNGAVLNNADSCAVQNYGVTPYVIIGQDMGGRAEYVLDFALKDVLKQYPGTVIMSATLELVVWWSSDRDNVAFDVLTLTPADPWFEGKKDHALAKDNDSSWQYRQIIGPGEQTKNPWSGGDGPASSAVLAGSIGPAFVMGGEHPSFKSTEIPGHLLMPWIADPDPSVGGFVITHADAPILVKNLDQGADQYDPKLHLVLCPDPGP